MEKLIIKMATYIFQKVPYLISVTIVCMTCPHDSYSQHALSGYVHSSADSIPLTGAFVTVDSLGMSTSAGTDGSFDLLLPAGTHTVRIKHLGYLEQTLFLDTPLDGPIHVFLTSDNHWIDEVTVLNTGFQQIPRERATGSFEFVGIQRLNEQISPDIMGRLEGVVSSLSVDRRTNSPGMMIRGLSSINGPRAPLVVLDNFPFEGDLASLNPNDVESITILKDAAAASIWGARAGNGVIVITTKKAELNSRLKIETNTNATLIAKPDLYYGRSVSPSDLVDVETMLFGNGFFNSIENSPNRTPLSPVVELLIAERDGRIGSSDAEQLMEHIRNGDVREQYGNHMYRTGLNTQNHLMLSQGSSSTAWKLSVGYDDNVSNLSSGHTRFNIDAKTRLHIGKRLNLSFNSLFSLTKTTSGKPDLSDLTVTGGRLPIYTRLVDESGTALSVMKNYREAFTDTLGAGLLLDWRYYPYADYKETRATEQKQYLDFNVILDYQLIKGLNANVNFRHIRLHQDGNVINTEHSHMARELINVFSQITNGTVNRTIPFGAIWDRDYTRGLTNDLRGQLSYQMSAGNHELNLLMGSEMRDALTNTSSGRDYGVDIHTLSVTTSIDMANPYPTLITGGRAYVTGRNSLSRRNQRFVSWYANGAYTFSGKYTLSFSGRRDASNLFGVATNDKWNALWSAGAQWMVSDEDFFNVHWIPHLRFRATYGLSGNVNNNMAAVTTIRYVSGTSIYTGHPTATFSNYMNPELRWEQVRTFNVGTDFRLFDNRISGSAEYYRKNARDLFGPDIIDYTGGIGTSITRNVASMQASGIDLSLRTVNTIGSVGWTTDLFLNHYRDKVTAYHLANTRGSNFVNGDLSIAGIVGQPVYSLYSYPWGGLSPENGMPQGFFNGALSTDYRTLIGPETDITDMHFHGPVYPRLFGAVGNTIRYRGISLALRVGYEFGHYFRRNALSYQSLFSSRHGHEEFSRRWQKPGDEKITDVPAMVYPAESNRDAFYTRSAVTVERADNIRVQYVNLTYRFSGAKLGRLNFNDIDLTVIANNIGVIWVRNTQGLDPRYRSMLPQRTLSVGLRTNF